MTVSGGVAPTSPEDSGDNGNSGDNGDNGDSGDTMRPDVESRRIEQELRSSQQRLHALSDATFEAIFLSEKGICLEQNLTAERMFGYTSLEAVGRPGTEWIVPADRELVMSNMLSGVETPYEVTALRKDGTTFPVEIQARMIDHGGRRVRVTALRDITLRRKAEKALRAEFERFVLVMDSLDAVVYVADMETHELLFQNRLCREVFCDGLGEPCWRVLQKGLSGPCGFCTNSKLVDPEGNPTGPFVCEVRNTLDDEWYECRGEAIHWPDGRLVRLEVSTRIGERKEAEEALRRRERYLKGLNRAARVLLASEGKVPSREFLAELGPVSGASRTYVFLNHFDDDGRLLMSREAEWCAEGVPPETDSPELRNLPHAEHFARWREILSRGGIVNGRVADFPEEEHRILEPQGILAVLVFPIMIDEEFAGFIGFDNCSSDREWDASELAVLRLSASCLGQAIRRSRAEQAVRESEERLGLALQGANLGTWDVDIRSGRITGNRRLFEILGRRIAELETDMGSCRSLVHPDDLPRVDSVARRIVGGRSPAFEIEFRLRGGSDAWTWVFVSGKVIERAAGGGPRRGCGTLLDISKRKSGEEAMYRASRMEATATLAGGIAHDFNNLMVSTLGYAELLRERFAESPAAKEMLDRIMQSAHRAGELAQQMLAFARGGKYLPVPLNLNDVIQETLRLQDRSFPPRIRVERDIEPGLWSTEADRTQMDQVVMNLSLNAAEAIEDHGRVVIATRNVEIGPSGDAEHPDLGPGRYVRLSVEDDGCGMDAGARARAFEPFFSTKFQGRGLGLASVHGIVRNHGGHIFVNSVPGRGTTFEVYLPACNAASEKALPAEIAYGAGTETILVIDDEPMVLDVARMMLETLGYRVLTAEQGREAVSVAEEFDGDIHLALLDIGMPVMGGDEAFPGLVRARPGLKVIICSGYGLDETSQTLLDAGADGFLRKPFNSHELAAEIRRVLG